MHRRERSELRMVHKASLEDGSFEEILPSPLAPELFSDLSEIYWNCLKGVKDPRQESLSIYPLSWILHLYFTGNRHGILFPKKQSQRDPELVN